MKLALICPSNLLYMPYVSNYETILKDYEIQYDLINWDRFHIEDISDLTYRDSKIGHQRNYLDYYNYRRFIKEKLESTNYDKVIVFSIQLSYFIKDILIKKYKNNYILDIRDYNKIMKYFGLRRVLNSSSYTVISSPGYREWLPSNNKYIVNHNSQIKSLDEIKEVNIPFDLYKICIASIGATRDLDINLSLINSLKNNKKIDLYYHGEGDINKEINDYIQAQDIKNVFLTGRYQKSMEESLYQRSSLISVLRYNDGTNNKTALPNRLYNAVFYGKPLLVFEGTFLANIIKKYNLGLLINSFDNIEDKVINYFKDFDIESYKESRISFFEKVIKENDDFKFCIRNFISK